MWTGRTARLCLSIVSASALVALAAAAPALASPAGTSAWRDRTATATGPFTASRMSVTLELGWRHAGALKALVARPHAALTPAQFAARFAPRKHTLHAIDRWAAAHQLTVGSVTANRELVRVSGSSAQIGRALHTSFQSFESTADGSFFAATRRAKLPNSFARSVTAVLGLSSLGKVTVPQPATRNGDDLEPGHLGRRRRALQRGPRPAVAAVAAVAQLPGAVHAAELLVHLRRAGV
ncbi:MAG TPA: protease pro-enzyme activation domain-containing protein [Solirubrobacteraceae bacterium]